MGNLVVLTTEDRRVAEALANQLEKQARNHPRMRLIGIFISLVVFVYSGIHMQNIYYSWTSESKTILDRVDAVSIPPDVPLALRISSESRKGLLMLEIMMKMRSLGALIMTIDLILFNSSLALIIIILLRWRSGERYAILGRLLHHVVQQMDDQPIETASE